jgi:hypothetical protein
MHKEEEEEALLLPMTKIIYKQNTHIRYKQEFSRRHADNFLIF